MRAFLRLVVLGVMPAVFAGACRDPVFDQLNPLMVTDTFRLGVPALAPPELPPALDLTSSGGFIGGGRFPERARDANRGWDVAARARQGQLVLLPSGVPGYDTRAAVFGPVQGQSFEELSQVPSGARFETDSVAVMQPGALYLIRSREFGTAFGGCLQYAKLEALEADPATGVLRVRVATNERCFDTRLAAPDG